MERIYKEFETPRDETKKPCSEKQQKRVYDMYRKLINGEVSSVILKGNRRSE